MLNELVDPKGLHVAVRVRINNHKIAPKALPRFLLLLQVPCQDKIRKIAVERSRL